MGILKANVTPLAQLLVFPSFPNFPGMKGRDQEPSVPPKDSHNSQEWEQGLEAPQNFLVPTRIPKISPSASPTQFSRSHPRILGADPRNHHSIWGGLVPGSIPEFWGTTQDPSQNFGCRFQNPSLNFGMQIQGSIPEFGMQIHGCTPEF